MLVTLDVEARSGGRLTVAIQDSVGSDGSFEWDRETFERHVVELMAKHLRISPARIQRNEVGIEQARETLRQAATAEAARGAFYRAERLAADQAQIAAEAERELRGPVVRNDSPMAGPDEIPPNVDGECAACRRTWVTSRLRAHHEEPAGTCPVCGGPVRPLSP